MATLSIYLDASIVVSLFANDPFSNRAEEFLGHTRTDLFLSNFASVEVASALGIRVRVGNLSPAEARQAFSNFDQWAKAMALNVEISAVDISVASNFLRQLDLGLRAPDAIHLATTQRLRAQIATFDKKMARVAQSLGISVAKA